MKTTTHILATLLLGLTLTQVSAQPVQINDPSGLNTLINTNNLTFEEEVGNIDVADFNALGEGLAFTFESSDGYTGSGNLASIQLLETNSSPINLRIVFGGTSGYRVLSTFEPTGGSNALAVGPISGVGGTVILDFIDPLNTCE